TLQLVTIEKTRRGRKLFSSCDREVPSGQAPRLFDAGDALEGEHQPFPVRPRGGEVQRPLFGSAGPDELDSRSKALREVRCDLDGDLPRQAVRLANGADQKHEKSKFENRNSKFEIDAQSRTRT